MKIIFEIEDANKFIDGLLTEVKESEKYFAKGSDLFKRFFQLIFEF